MSLTDKKYRPLLLIIGLVAVLAIGMLVSKKMGWVGGVQAQFKNAGLSYERNRKLFADKVVAESEMDVSQSAFDVSKNEVEAAAQSVEAAKFNVKSAQASVEEARKNLSRTSIFSPVDGT